MPKKAAKKPKLGQLPDLKRQVAALPFRLSASGAVEILVITSRETGRFIIPKGWPMKRLRDPDAAAREAYEEAGVTGKIRRKSVGSYNYWKRLTSTFELVEVEVYPLEVQEQHEDWPEKGRRQKAWLSPKDAALLIDEPDLATLVRGFSA